LLWRDFGSLFDVHQPPSLADAVSFEVMSRDGLEQAFAFDRRFRTAGFEMLA
jgi:hypothetical protein